MLGETNIPETDLLSILKVLIINNSKIVETSSELISTSSELISTSSELISTGSELIRIIAELLIISVFKKTQASVSRTLEFGEGMTQAERSHFQFGNVFW